MIISLSDEYGKAPITLTTWAEQDIPFPNFLFVIVYGQKKKSVTIPTNFFKKILRKMENKVEFG